MKKRFLMMVVCVMLAAMSTAIAACNRGTSIKTFDVPESMTAEYMTMCSLPVISATDTKGKEYVADISVKDSDGMTVSVLNNSFFVDKETPYTAEYSVTVDKKRTAKTMQINVSVAETSFIRLAGKLQYWLEPGEFDVATFDYDIIDSTGENVSTQNITYSITDSAGNNVELNSGKATLAKGVYEVAVAADGETAVNRIAIYVTEKKYDDEGRYIYADFSDEVARNLFSTDYTQDYYRIENGHDWTGLCRSWSETSATWKIVFLSDAFADFSHGGRVWFDSVMMSENTGYRVYYYPADGGARQKIGEFLNLGWYAGKTLYFDIPAGGQLEGASIEFEKIEPESVWGHAVGNFKISTDYFVAGTTRAAAKGDESVNLDELGVTVTDVMGHAVSGTKNYAVTDENGAAVDLNGNTFVAESGKLYTVKISVDGIPAIPSVKIAGIRERYTVDGKLIYADFGETAGDPDELDSYLFQADFEFASVEYLAIGWAGSKYGLCKYFTTDTTTSFGFTFLSDGYADLSGGGVLEFDSFFATQTANYNIYLYSADDTLIDSAELPDRGDQEVTHSRFTIPAGSTLAGCRLVITTSTNASDTFAFGNVTIDTRPLISGAPSYFVKAGDTFDLTAIDVTNAAGTAVMEGIAYTVTEVGGTTVNTTGNVFRPEPNKMYEVAVKVGSADIAEKVMVVCRDNRTTDDGKIIYADFGATHNGGDWDNDWIDPDDIDSYLFETDFVSEPKYLDIGWHGSKYGLCKYWNVQPASFGFTFLTDGYADLSAGGVVEFDIASIESTEYSVYYQPATGARITVAELSGLVPNTVQHLRFKAVGTLVGGKIEVVPSDAAHTFMFGNVTVDTRLGLAGETMRLLKPSVRFDLDTLDIEVVDAADQSVGGNIAFAVTDQDGTPVSLADGNILTPAADKLYTVTVSVSGQVVAGNVKLLCRSERISDGKIVYADFGYTHPNGDWGQNWLPADSLDASLFKSDFEFGEFFCENGSKGAKFGMGKNWNNPITDWSFTFLSDGYADFTNGGVVEFNIGTTGSNGFNVYYEPAAGDRITVMENARGLMNVSFTVPAGGTLVGGKLIFHTDFTADAVNFGDMTIDTRAMLIGEKVKTAPVGEYDLTQAIAKQLVRAADISQLEFTAVKGENEPIDVSGGKLTVSDGAIYKVTVSYNGEAVVGGEFTVLGRNKRTTQDGKIIYADFGNTTGDPDELDSRLFTADFDYTYMAIGWAGSKYGVSKAWSTNITTWNFTFLSDGYADFTNGGALEFDSFFACEGANYTVSLYSADNILIAQQELLERGDQEVTHSSFTIPAGGTLVGSRLVFSTSTNSGDGFAFGNVTISETIE